MSDNMNTVTLRTLLREPRKVKLMTGAGQAVQITDSGRPLWILTPVASPRDPERRQELEAELAEVLRGPRSNIGLSELVLESRR